MSDKPSLESILERLNALEKRMQALERRQGLELRTYNLTEAAEMLGISRTAINRLVDDGHVTPVRLYEGAHPRLRHTDLVRMLEGGSNG